jgi:hypothetical protein
VWDGSIRARNGGRFCWLAEWKENEMVGSASTRGVRTLDRWLETATTWGFILRQLGFVVVLLAGLVHQHGAEPVRQP